MRFALANSQRQEATPKARGICPKCKKSVIAKCGNIRDHHWAHEIALGCKNDRWEKEGPWHQNWKNQFPKEWQEQPVSFNNEIHIADIKTPQGLVIEFQHSHIEPEEQKSREFAYKDMIWVVDGTRLKNDFFRFQKISKCKDKKEICRIKKNIKIFSISSYDKISPKNWLNCSVTVVFDFLGEKKEEEANVFQKYLYFLLPRDKVKTDDFSAILLYTPRKYFIPLIKENKWQEVYSRMLSYLYT